MATSGQAALKSLVLDLERLERLRADEHARRSAGLEKAAAALRAAGSLDNAASDARKVAALQRFANDSPALEKLKELQEESQSQLDLFDVLGVADSEIHHSRFLAWLLDPQQTHAAGDFFLKSFLYHTCEGAEEAGLPHMASPEVPKTDWSETEVRLEWQNIDILILNRAAHFVCAIENKIWSPEGIGEDGSSQLTWYRETLQTHFPDFTRHYVFLSPSGMPSQIPTRTEVLDTRELRHSSQLVEQTLDCNGKAMREDVRTFLQQYANTLRRRNIVQDSTELKQLARKIYLEHRDAIDLINRHKPDFIAEAKQALQGRPSVPNRLESAAYEAEADTSGLRS